ncbi:hypothetical protein GOODEAATRI_028944, partial [Goodea atripinnis]
GQTGRECKMAHSCRWRFPARPGGSSNSGTGRRAGRIRVTAFLRSVSGTQPNAAGLGPGFDAALQVSSVIRSNLQKFRDVLGESSDSSGAEVSPRLSREHRVRQFRDTRAGWWTRLVPLRRGANGYSPQNLSLEGCSVNFE